MVSISISLMTNYFGHPFLGLSDNHIYLSVKINSNIFLIFKLTFKFLNFEWQKFFIYSVYKSFVSYVIFKPFFGVIPKKYLLNTKSQNLLLNFHLEVL